jgi:hypothetical protein
MRGRKRARNAEGSGPRTADRGRRVGRPTGPLWGCEPFVPQGKLREESPTSAREILREGYAFTMSHKPRSSG